MHDCCSSEREGNKIVESVSSLVNNVMWKIQDCSADMQEEYMMKFFKFLGSGKDIASIGNKLIEYKAMLEKKELEEEVAEEEAETKESKLDLLFNQD